MSLASKILEIGRLPVESRVLLAAASLCLICCLALLIANPYAIAPEAALRLEMGRLLLAGLLPYRDFIDADPPAMMFLATIPALISSTCHLPIVTTGLICAFALTVASVITCIYLISKSELGKNPLALGCFAVACAAISNLFIFQFAEREHLLIILTLPYMLTRWLRASSEGIALPLPLTAILGLAAGLGFWLNLQYLLLPLIVEAAFLLQNNKFARLRSPEILGCLLGLSIIPIYMTLHKTVCQIYCSLIVPLWFNNFSFPMDDHVKYLDCSPDLRIYFYAAAMVYIASLALRKETSLFYPMTILSLTGFIFFITDKRGGTAQAILLVAPLVINASIVVALAAGKISRWANRRRKRIFSAFGLLLLALGLGSWGSWAFPTASLLRPAKTKLDPIQAGQPSEFSIWLDKFSEPGDCVIFLNDTISPAYPLTLLSGRKPCPPFLWGYPIRLLSDCHITEKELPEELINSPQQIFDKTYVNEQLAKLVQERVPKLMFIQQGRTEDYLRKHESFNHALEENYKPMGEANQIKLQKTEPAFISGCWYSFTVWLRED